MSTFDSADSLIGQPENANNSNGRFSTVHHMIRKQVHKTPEKPALIINDEIWTYQQLSRLSDLIAQYLLLSINIKTEQLIGVFASRSISAVIAILGILKAGGAYLPLDPRYPLERLRYIIQDSGVGVILTHGRLYEKLWSMVVDRVAVNIVNIDEILNLCQGQGQAGTEISIAPSHLAFVIYTSGTTGKPKGVMTTHGNISAYVKSLQTRLCICEQDRYLHTASVAFSSSNRQLMLPLSIGSTVVMARSEEHTNFYTLFELIKHQNVSIIDFVPTYLKSCIEFLSQLDRKTQTELLSNNLRMTLSASERLTYDIPFEWRKLLNRPIKYINMYGTTESTGIAAVYEVPEGDDRQAGVVSIGKPIPGMQMHILDQNTKPVSIGETGVLYLAGSCITRGYFNQPQQTKEKYIHNSFSGTLSSKLFHTGDLCCFTKEDNIAFMGRVDNQITLHGIRMEPVEIESVIKRFPGIKESVVVCKKAGPHSKLIAYYTSYKGSSIDPLLLRKFISHELPVSMVPSHFIQLKSIPLTPNQKIDRSALPELCESSFVTKDHMDEKPQNEIQWVLLKIWRTILGRKDIGIHNNFYEIGGDSLAGLKMISSIDRSFNIRIHYSILIEKPTIALLSEYLASRELRTSEQVIPSINQTRKHT